MTAVSVLGDSLTCGRGVGVRVPERQTWPALVAQSTPGIEVRSLAAPGARIADVRRLQLPWIPVERAKGGVVILIAGLNDVCRAGFDRAGIHRELSLTVATAEARGATVVLGRLHDPAAVLRLRGAIATAISRRVAVVNDAVDAAADRAGIHVLDLSTVPALAAPGGWAADRIHPSPAGHRGIAFAAAGLLFEAGFAPRSRLVPAHPGPGPSAAATAWWALRHGVPYSIKHLPDFGPPLMAALTGA
jgi:lysophospholipase L1-like esterase